MPRRVSVKGRGTEIFFGDYLPAGRSEEEAAAPAPPLPAEEGPRAAPARPRRRKADRQASMQASGHAQGLERQRGWAALPPEHLDALLALVAQRATITNAFRYTERELEELSDAIYEIGKGYGVRLSKQDVARLGLNLVLRDYRERGEASLLAQLAGRRRGGEPRQ